MSKSKKKRAVKKLNKTEQRRAAKVAAMPEVKALVSKHGLSAVRACVTGLAAKQKALRELGERKKEIAALERSLRTGRLAGRR